MDTSYNSKKEQPLRFPTYPPGTKLSKHIFDPKSSIALKKWAYARDNKLPKINAPNIVGVFVLAVALPYLCYKATVSETESGDRNLKIRGGSRYSQ